MEALGINLGYLLAFALSFGILFVVLRAWVFTPLLGQLEKRRVAIMHGLEDAREAAEARANAEKEANRIIAEAQVRASALIREATERADKVEAEIRAQADQDAAHARDTARVELQEERNRMLSELRGQIATLAIAAAQKLLAENLDERRQRQLVSEFFSGICDGRVRVMEENGSALASGGPQAVEITSALPLTDQEKVLAQQDFSRRLGCDGRVNFRVDPSLLGGLVVRIGDQVVDGSLSGQLEELRQNLN